MTMIITTIGTLDHISAIWDRPSPCVKLGAAPRPAGSGGAFGMEGRVRQLSSADVEAFIEQGFVRLDEAFPSELADQARDILWRDTGCDPDDPSTWTKPVVRLGFYSQPPFVAAANTDTLKRAFDQLVGPGRWLPCGNVGTFPVRFPSSEDPGDTGWHVDVKLRDGEPGLSVLARQRPFEGSRALDAVAVF